MSKETMSSAAVATILKGTTNVQVNTNALPAAPDKSLAIYEKDGTLIGYIPIYTSEWAEGAGGELFG